jgi:mannosylglucosylglycerate synthase
VALCKRALDDLDWVEQMVEHNYEIARRHYSFTILKHHFQALLTELFGI